MIRKKSLLTALLLNFSLAGASEAQQRIIHVVPTQPPAVIYGPVTYGPVITRTVMPACPLPHPAVIYTEPVIVSPAPAVICGPMITRTIVTQPLPPPVIIYSEPLIVNQPIPKIVYEPVYRTRIIPPTSYSWSVDGWKPDDYRIIKENPDGSSEIVGSTKIRGDERIKFLGPTREEVLPPRAKIIYEYPQQNNAPVQEPFEKRRHYTITPLSERTLPNGMLEIKVFTPEGTKTYQTTPGNLEPLRFR